MRSAILYLAAAAAVVAPAQATPQAPPPVRYFETVCGALGAIEDACGMAQAAAELLSPTYENDKRGRGIARLEHLGYAAEYIAAGGGLFRDTTDVFLAARRGSDRLYIVVTGTESTRDWFENLKAKSYTTLWRDGYYYTPPAHAGFRSGVLNVLGAVLKRNEFDETPLTCEADGSAREGASRLTAFLCRSRVQSSPSSPVSVVLIGHSRGAAIATLVAPAFAGYEIKLDGERADVARQAHWPLAFGGLVGFAPPYALYTRTDEQAGMRLPPGAPDQWQVYGRAGILERTITFYNERDIVPQLSLGLGRQLGHRFRITDTSKIEYMGYGSPNTVSFIEAHASAGYCHDLLLAFGREDRDNLYCDDRTYSETGAK
ncbi:MAG TPA: hypothetical protein VEB68_08290 [Croceibacterium sp.]|nr:hypothetical protein [Croceibacterium sp.]